MNPYKIVCEAVDKRDKRTTAKVIVGGVLITGAAALAILKKRSAVKHLRAIRDKLIEKNRIRKQNKLPTLGEFIERATKDVEKSTKELKRLERSQLRRIKRMEKSLESSKSYFPPKLSIAK